MPALFGNRPQGLGAPQSGGLGGFMQNASSFRDQNPGALTALGAGIMSGNPAAGFAGAAPVIARGRQNNATAQFLMAKGITKDPREALTVAQNEDLLRFVLKDGGDEYSKRAEAAARYGIKPDDPRYQGFVLGLDDAGGRQEIWSVTPTLGKGPDGKPMLGVSSNFGNFRPLDTGGFEPFSPYDKSYDRSAGGAAGKAQGEATANLDSMNANMPGLEATVKQLGTLSERATYTPGGKLVDTAMRWADMEPREAAVARTKYMAIVDNQVLPLLRETFGAQFTVQEGESLRATLGAPDATPTEKKAVLDAFIEQKRRNIAALAAQTGQPGMSGTVAPPAGGNTRLRFNPATGELE